MKPWENENSSWRCRKGAYITIWLWLGGTVFVHWSKLLTGQRTFCIHSLPKCSRNYEILKQQGSTISCSANVWKTCSLVGKAISLLTDKMNMGNHDLRNTRMFRTNFSRDQHEACLGSWSSTRTTTPPRDCDVLALAFRLLMLVDEMQREFS